MKITNVNIQTAEPDTAGGERRSNAFTLIELLVVIAIIALLAAMLLPMLSRAKMSAQNAQDMNNMKQLGLGINCYADDHTQIYPAAALEDQGYMTGGPLSYDVWINRYIGGNSDFSQLTVSDPGGGGGAMDPSEAPKILRCPADILPDVAWATGADAAVARRTYSMIQANPNPTMNGSSQPNCTPPNYYPALQTPQAGIGVGWEEETESVDWDAPGYPTRVIQDASGTILLAEHPDGDNFVGNAYMATVQVPTNNSAGQSPGGGNAGPQAQLDPNDSWNYGTTVYAAHGMKFHYLFHDNHVSTLSWQQTIGTTKPQYIETTPLGMWTIKAGD